MNATLRCVRITVKYNPQKSTLPKDSSALPRNDGKYLSLSGKARKTRHCVNAELNNLLSRVI